MQLCILDLIHMNLRGFAFHLSCYPPALTFLIQTSLITYPSQISPLAVYDPKLCEFQVTYSNNILGIESPIPLFGIWPHSRDETEMNGWTDDRETRYTKCTHFFGSLLLRNIPPSIQLLERHDTSKLTWSDTNFRKRWDTTNAQNENFYYFSLPPKPLLLPEIIAKDILPFSQKIQLHS